MTIAGVEFGRGELEELLAAACAEGRGIDRGGCGGDELLVERDDEHEDEPIAIDDEEADRCQD